MSGSRSVDRTIFLSLYSYTLLIRGRQPVTLIDGAGCGPAGLASSAGSREARVTVRSHYGGPPSMAGRGPAERRRKPPGSGNSRRPRKIRSRSPKSRGEAPIGAPVRVMDRRPSRRRDRPGRKTGPQVRRSAPAPFGASPPRAFRAGISDGDRAPQKSPERSRLPIVIPGRERSERTRNP
jgi:hypothetical protein